MKKPLLLMLLAMVSATMTRAQDVPNITLTVSPDGAERTIRVMTNASDKKFLVDWGDGVKQETAVIYQGDALNTTDQKNVSLLTGTPVGTGEVKIYGEGINFFHINKVGVTHLDVTGAPDVEYLYLSNNANLTELDLSKSTKLKTILLTKTGLRNLDFSACTELGSVQATSGNVESVNLSACTKLTNLTLTQCKLTQIDFSACTALTTIKLQQNALTKVIAPTTMPEQATVNIQKNALKMSDLPNLIVKSYTYAPQNPMLVAESYGVGEQLDLSSENNLRGVKVTVKKTEYTLLTEDKTPLTVNEDYKVEDGVVTFLKSQPKKVYVRMTTDAFPYFQQSASYNFVTTSFEVKTPTGIIDRTGHSSQAQPTVVFGVDGRRKETLAKGMNVVRYSDGTTRVIVRQ